MSSRDSGFELLRIVAILFVVTHHVLLFGSDLCGYLTPFSPDWRGIVGVAANSVVVVGVSLFVMISGWFGIRRVWQPMLRLVVECALFGALSLGLCLLLYSFLPIGRASGHWSLIRLWDSMKFTNWWFIVHYLLLVLCSPLLERALDGIGRRTLERALLCLAVFNMVFGFWWEYVNVSGYNVVQFVFLYVLARYMRLFPRSLLNRIVGRWAWLLVLLCATAMTLLFLADKQGWIPGHSPKVWNYNCPLVVLEAMAVFSLFTRVKLRSASVNYVASLILGVYLIQSSPNLVWYRNALGQWLYGQLGVFGIIVAVALLTFLCLLLSAMVMPLARWVSRKMLPAT